MNAELIPKRFGTEEDLKLTLANHYQKQITNFFGDEKKALRFLSSVVASFQRNPKLAECTGESVVNSFMIMAQLELIPSDVSGEAYVIPYGNLAQFQLGYQGLVTLFYRAGVKKIVAEIVYENDQFRYVNGEVEHEPDVFSSERGKPKGAYVIVTLHTGATVTKVMSRDDIFEIAKTFSKSYAAGKKSPWDPKNDPQLWMWRKTVLKQAAKLIPKSDKLIEAIGLDNKDSIIADRLEPAKEMIPELTMGNILKTPNDHAKETKPEEGSGKGTASDSGSDNSAAGSQSKFV